MQVERELGDDLRRVVLVRPVHESCDRIAGFEVAEHRRRKAGHRAAVPHEAFFVSSP